MPRRVRVLQLIDSLGPGGAEMLILTLAGGIDRSRFEMHACTLRKLPQFKQADQLRAMGVPVLELSQRNSYDVPALLSIVAYVRKHRVDIIHTHLLAADVMGRMAGTLTGRPVVSTIHNTRTDLDLEPKRRQWLERWTARLMCKRLIIVSKLLRQETAEWFGVPLKKVVAITNGVDTERFRRGPDFDRAEVKRALLGGDYPLVVNVGRLVPQKGHRYLLEAAQTIARERPDARIVLLGDGVERESIEAGVRELGLEGSVILAGYRYDVDDVLAASDVFVMSSLWEGMPIALLEAMSAGCAAVATNVGGVPEVLRDGVTGLLVPSADPEALAAATLRCLNEPDMARKLGATAQAWVTANYSRRAWARKLESLYLRELAMKRRA